MGHHGPRAAALPVTPIAGMMLRMHGPAASKVPSQGLELQVGHRRSAHLTEQPCTAGMSFEGSEMI